MTEQEFKKLEENAARGHGAIKRRSMAALKPLANEEFIQQHKVSESDKEVDLHGEIIAECQQRMWIYYHGSTARRTSRVLGEPDFEILADGGRTFLIECKTKTGKLTPGQKAMIHWAAKLGHTIHVCRSIEQFKNIVK